MLAIVSSSKTGEQLDKEKQAVAKAAVKYVRSNMLLGLGTGSTANYFLSFLAERIRTAGLKIEAVGSSLHTAARAKELGIAVHEPRRGVRVDLTIDGADEIAPDLTLIKGAGGALLREKLVAQNSARLIIIADAGKLVTKLGTKFPLPVEVTQFGFEASERFLRELGCTPVMR